MKKTLGIPSIAFLLLFACSSETEHVTEQASVMTPPSQQPIPEQPVVPQNVDAPEDWVTKIARVAGLPPHDHNLGEPFTLGPFSYKITSRSFSSSVGKRFSRMNAPTGSEFLIVRYEETNQGNETVTVIEGTMEFVDSKGRTFRPDSKAMSHLAISGDVDIAITELHPGVTRQSVVAFQIPEGIRDGVLIVKERGMVSTGKSRVLLETHQTELAMPAAVIADSVILPQLEKRRFGKIREFMAPEDSSKVSDATMEEWAVVATEAKASRGNRDLLPSNNPENTVNGELVSTKLKYFPPRGRWNKNDGGVVITLRHRGGKYYFVDIRIDPPRGLR